MNLHPGHMFNKTIIISNTFSKIEHECHRERCAGLINEVQQHEGWLFLVFDNHIAPPDVHVIHFVSQIIF